MRKRKDLSTVMVRGKIPALIQLFYAKSTKTIRIKLQEGGHILIHPGGEVVTSRRFINTKGAK